MYNIVGEAVRNTYLPIQSTVLLAQSYIVGRDTSVIGLWVATMCKVSIRFLFGARDCSAQPVGLDYLNHLIC